jgi:hypothetical protein
MQRRRPPHWPSSSPTTLPPFQVMSIHEGERERERRREKGGGKLKLLMLEGRMSEGVGGSNNVVMAKCARVRGYQTGRKGIRLVNTGGWGGRGNSFLYARLCISVCVSAPPSFLCPPLLSFLNLAAVPAPPPCEIQSNTTTLSTTTTTPPPLRCRHQAIQSFES